MQIRIEEIGFKGSNPRGHIRVVLYLYFYGFIIMLLRVKSFCSFLFYDLNYPFDVDQGSYSFPAQIEFDILNKIVYQSVRVPQFLPCELR